MAYSNPSDSDTMENYNEDLENYKGIFYDNNDQEENLYECGAHFSYIQMCKKLEDLKKEREKDFYREECELKSSLPVMKNQGKLIFK